MAEISVIVPVYKVEPYLRRCVDSILSQTFRDFDLILIDDGSPDGCGAICDEYAVRDSRIHVIHQENGGLSAARNAGLDWSFANSLSRFLTLVDSDDWLARNCLEELRAHVTPECRISCCNPLECVAGGTPPDDDAPLMPWRTVNVEEFWTGLAVFPSVAWGKLYAKELFTDVRFPPGRIHEDEFTTHRVLFKCDSVAFCSAGLYRYFRRPDSITGAAWNDGRLDKIPAFTEQLAFFNKIGCAKAAETSRRGLMNALLEAVEHGHAEFRPQLRRELTRAPLPLSHATKRIHLAAHPLCMKWRWPVFAVMYRVRKVARILAGK